MKPKKSENEVPQLPLFQTPLKSFLNSKHPLVVLSKQIDWAYFEDQFGAFFNDRGRPALPIRLVVALTYLKHTYDLGDEPLVEQFLEKNAYWQYFCGFEYFQQTFPCEASSLVRWRKRMREEGCQKLLNETLRLAHTKKILRTSQLQEVIIDTTVQEKNITHPTDAKLLHRMREKLVKTAKVCGIHLRQSYSRVGKFLTFKQSKYVHAKQYKRARKAVKKLKTILGRVMRDIERKCENPDKRLKELLILSHRLLFQKKESKNKIYSLHEPDVDCISKGKSHKPYEFGCKTSVTSTAQGNWVLGVNSFHGNPFDGHTLKAVTLETEKNTGITIEAIFVDKGYRGSKHCPKGKMVLVSGRKRLKTRLKRLLKRRSAIEPIIGHLKQDHRLSRNLLKGKLGDHLNGIFSGAAFNFKKLIRYTQDIFVFLFWNFQTKKSNSTYLPIPLSHSK